MKIMLIRWNLIFFAILFIPVVSYALCVTASTANLRSGPGTKNKVVWKVYRYMPLEKIRVSSSGIWYAVRDVDGYTEWVYKSLVTSRYRCAVVKSKTANIRTGPGTAYPRKYTEQATRYDTFKVIGRKGAWIRTQDEYGDTGWIYRNLLWIK